MGAVNSAPALYEEGEPEAQMAALTEKLPRLRTCSHGPNVLELQGESWFFNSQPPFDESLLRGLLSPSAYQNMVDRINCDHCAKYVGLSKTYPKSEIQRRRQMGKDSVMETIKVLNAVDLSGTGCRWDMQAGRETVTVTGVNARMGGKHGHSRISSTTEHRQETFLYLVLPPLQAAALAT